MKLTAESTEKVVTLNGVPVRIWEATTETGIPCHLYVARVAVAPDQDCAQFERELKECKPPRPEIAAIPLRLII